MSMFVVFCRRRRIRIPVAVDDMIEFFGPDAEGQSMVSALESNTMRFMDLFCDVIDALLKERFANQVVFDVQDTSDVYLMHRTTTGADVIYPP